MNRESTHQEAQSHRSAQSQDYLRLNGAQIVSTETLAEVHDTLSIVTAARGVGLIYGMAGVGKTLAVNVALRNLAPTSTIGVTLRSRPTTRDIRHALFYGLQLAGKPPANVETCDNLLKHQLAGQRRVVAFDEAQWLTAECLAYLHRLYGPPGTGFPLVFVAGNNDRHWLGDWPQTHIHYQSVNSMKLREVMQVLPAFHPVWSRTEPAVIEYADRHGGHGNFRAWANITRHVLQALPRHNLAAPDLALMQRVFNRLGNAE